MRYAEHYFFEYLTVSSYRNANKTWQFKVRFIPVVILELGVFSWLRVNGGISGNMVDHEMLPLGSCVLGEETVLQ